MTTPGPSETMSLEVIYVTRHGVSAITFNCIVSSYFFFEKPRMHED